MERCEETLPLLALPEYYETAKFGYARGGMPIAFVDRVRAYYDILPAQPEPAYTDRGLHAGVAEAPPGAVK